VGQKLRAPRPVRIEDCDEVGGAVAALMRHRLGELRDLARGIHLAVLADRGLEAALQALVQRAPMHVDLRAEVSSV
jgi:hypothetical protein